MGILHQTLNLIISSLPTVCIVFLFFLFARVVFFKPMLRVLEERAARTEGARSDAARLDSQAQEKLALYHRALAKVRSEIYSEQEAARHAALEERSRLLHETRAKAGERVRREKERLEGELAGARDQVERQSARLAEQAAQAVLAESSPVGEAAGDS